MYFVSDMQTKSRLLIFVTFSGSLMSTREGNMVGQKCLQGRNTVWEGAAAFPGSETGGNNDLFRRIWFWLRGYWQNMTNLSEVRCSARSYWQKHAWDLSVTQEKEGTCLCFAFLFFMRDLPLCQQSGVRDKVDAISLSALQFSWAAVWYFASSFVFSMLWGKRYDFFLLNIFISLLQICIHFICCLFNEYLSIVENYKSLCSEMELQYIKLNLVRVCGG